MPLKHMRPLWIWECFLFGLVMASAGHEHATPVDFGRRGLTNQIISPNQIYSGGTGSQTYISDPASSQTLSANENTALLDLYSALIRGSPAEAHFHSDWHSMTSTGNLCAFQGMWYQVFEPGQRSVSWNAQGPRRLTSSGE